MTRHAAQILALRWFAAREPVVWFDKTAPSHSMRTRLIRRNLIERVTVKGVSVQMVKFRLTAEGRQVLVDGGWL